MKRSASFFVESRPKIAARALAVSPNEMGLSCAWRKALKLQKMNDSIASLLEEASQLSSGASARNRIEDRLLEESEITSMAQVATLVEAVARRAAIENAQAGDEDSAETLIESAQTIADALRRLHEIIQEMA